MATRPKNATHSVEILTVTHTLAEVCHTFSTLWPHWVHLWKTDRQTGQTDRTGQHPSAAVAVRPVGRSTGSCSCLAIEVCRKHCNHGPDCRLLPPVIVDAARAHIEGVQRHGFARHGDVASHKVRGNTQAGPRHTFAKLVGVPVPPSPGDAGTPATGPPRP